VIDNENVACLRPSTAGVPEASLCATYGVVRFLDGTDQTLDTGIVDSRTVTEDTITIRVHCPLITTGQCVVRAAILEHIASGSLRIDPAQTAGVCFLGRRAITDSLQ
jgi:hypothetical protein